MRYFFDPKLGLRVKGIDLKESLSHLDWVLHKLVNSYEPEVINPVIEAGKNFRAILEQQLTAPDKAEADFQVQAAIKRAGHMKYLGGSEADYLWDKYGDKIG